MGELDPGKTEKQGQVASKGVRDGGEEEKQTPRQLSERIRFGREKMAEKTSSGMAKGPRGTGPNCTEGQEADKKKKDGPRWQKS